MPLSPRRRGEPNADQHDRRSFLLLMNAGEDEVDFVISRRATRQAVDSMVETASAALPPSGFFEPTTRFRLAAHSLALLAGEG